MTKEKTTSEEFLSEILSLSKDLGKIISLTCLNSSIEVNDRLAFMISINTYVMFKNAITTYMGEISYRDKIDMLDQMHYFLKNEIKKEYEYKKETNFSMNKEIP